MSMRPYQAQAIQEIQTHFARGTKKILLKLPTGGGKTHIFSHIMKQASERGNPTIMAVRGRQLVDQASKRLFHEGVAHGVRMASHWNRNYGALAQVCSIDTLLSRNDFPPAKLVVIDEAHLFGSDGCKEFLKHYDHAFVLAVTATPWTKDGLTHLADAVVNPISMGDLIEQGYLVPPKYFAPSTPDLKGVHTRNGDYVNEELQERMNVLTGDIVSHWKSLAQNRPTICFAVNIKHSLSIVAQFNKQGIPAEHIEGDNNFKEREDAIQRLKTGKIRVLSNVGILCTGVDMPFASAILMARPTKSYSLYVQQAGRGTRISPDTSKSDFLILDHAGNVLRHGFLTDEPEIELAGIKTEGRASPVRVCEKCFVCYQGPVCTVCGFVPPPLEKDDTVELEAGTLSELDKIPEWAEIKIFIARHKELAKRRGHHHMWAFHKTKERFGEEIASIAFQRKIRKQPWFS